MTQQLERPKTWQERLSREGIALRLRTNTLQNYVQTKDFASLPLQDREDLHEQLQYMQQYLTVLKRRARRAGVAM